MTTKDKAKDLIEKFMRYGATDFVAKECALICVNEILIELNNIEQGESGKVNGYFGQSYWLQVKINLLKL